MRKMRRGSILTYISTVYLSARARKCIQYEVKRYPAVETGGILIGAPLSHGNYLVTHATSPGPSAFRRPTVFKKDWSYTINVLKYLENRHSVIYLGEWHSHTLAGKPSFQDVIAMKRVALKNKGPLLLLIVSGGEKKAFYLVSPAIVRPRIKRLTWIEVNNPGEIFSKYEVVVT